MGKKKITFTNSVGDEFELFPLNPLEEQVIKQQMTKNWQAAGRPLPALPAYEVTTVTGEIQRVQVDSQEKAEAAGIGEAWAEYERLSDEFNEEYGNRFLNSVYLCVGADPDQYPRWKMHMRALEVDIPEDEIDRFFLFVKTWVIRSTHDLGGLVFAATGSLGVNQEARAAAEEKFRAVLEEALSGTFTSAGW